MPKKSVSIDIGGKKRHLRYDFNALEAIQEELGVSPIDPQGLFGVSLQDSKKELNSEEVTSLAKNLNIKNLKVMVWAGLLHEDENLEKREVGGWLDLGNFVDIFGKVLEAYLSSLQDETPKNSTSLKTNQK